MEFPIERFNEKETPFYYYDTDLLRQTLAEINRCTKGLPYHVHYAIKANANAGLLEVIRQEGLGIDCVSGGELKAALAAGFEPRKIVFAGVAKTDKEIRAGLEAGIQCFNVESMNELEVINELAKEYGTKANVAIRINPNIDAHTHTYITTGLNENKFGISLEMLDDVISKALKMDGIELSGIHFHIGSQITENGPFATLCDKINELVPHLESLGANIRTINVGGGLGIDYTNPDGHPIADFESYFGTFKTRLHLKPHQELHFELGRSVVAQCGALITRVISGTPQHREHHLEISRKRLLRCSGPDMRIVGRVWHQRNAAGNPPRRFAGIALGRCIRRNHGFALQLPRAARLDA